ncbi:MAG: cupin domain-containing protein [Pseudomonadota bacterium]
MAGLHRFETDPAAGMQPSNFASQNAFTTSDTSETNHSYVATDDQSRLSGVWECAPCREQIKAYPVDEMMTVISGCVTVTVNGEPPQTFVTGDTFFIEKGTACTWEITETLRKFYFIAG